MTKTQELVREFHKMFDDRMREIERAVREEFPVGRRVSWRRSAHLQFGRVMRHCYGNAVFVRNERTGAEVRIDAHLLELQ